ncbi:MAG TPA: hypothetical protein VLJ61_19260 [Pyrinomonadaceae bacterium]|nr:hypothetical protein [Pyrinomonadaceae bacterium]
MRLKTALLLPLLACALAAAGCRQAGTGGVAGGAGVASSGDVDSVIGKLNSFTTELSNTVEVASDANAGVEAAQKLLDSRKAELTASVAALKRDAKFQQDAAARRKWLEAEVDDTDRVSRLQVKFLDTSMRDAAFKSRLDNLVGDYNSIFKEPETR